MRLPRYNTLRAHTHTLLVTAYKTRDRAPWMGGKGMVQVHGRKTWEGPVHGSLTEVGIGGVERREPESQRAREGS